VTVSLRLPTLLLSAVLLLAAAIGGCGLLSISPAEPDSLTAPHYSDIGSAPQPEVNQTAPDFSARNADGEAVRLRQVSEQQPVLLLFYRGEWCPFCIDQLDSIKAVLPQLQAYGVQLIAVSPDDVATSQNTRRQFGQGFMFWSDTSGEAMQAYGIARDNGLPHPAVYLIGKGGELKWYYASEDYKQRPTGEQLLEVIKATL